MRDFDHALTVRLTRGGRTDGIRHGLAWTLLVGAVLIGIVAMHTLGHMAGDTPATGTSRAMAVEHVHGSAPMAEQTLVKAAGAGMELAGSRADASGPGMCSDPFDLCLAVVVVSGLVIALRRLGWRIEPARRDCAGPARPSSGPSLRGPPGFGLPIVRLSVLRI
jgi:Family of unknown function (DUF6153)